MDDQDEVDFIDYCRRRGRSNLLELPLADARRALVDDLLEVQESLTGHGPIHFAMDEWRREFYRQRAENRRRAAGAAPRENYLLKAAVRALLARSFAAMGISVPKIAKFLGVSVRHAHRLAYPLPAGLASRRTQALARALVVQALVTKGTSVQDIAIMLGISIRHAHRLLACRL